ncbi:hypothetical protein, partial [Ramlibacter cellulosilyticus]|uniref:hypothetical protein n=1 Tax=Ramlibacter cellulosilyticus TaxID=2764187 RepID=UPI001C9B46FC
EKEKQAPQDLRHGFKDQRLGTACARFRVAPKTRLEEYKAGFRASEPQRWRAVLGCAFAQPSLRAASDQ